MSPFVVEWLIETNNDRTVLPKSSLQGTVRLRLNQTGMRCRRSCTTASYRLITMQRENELRRLTIGRKELSYCWISDGGPSVRVDVNLGVMAGAPVTLGVWAYVDDVLRSWCGIERGLLNHATGTLACDSSGSVSFEYREQEQEGPSLDDAQRSNNVGDQKLRPNG